MTNKKLKVGNVPNNPLNVPKFRFSEFDEEWEVRKLGEIATFYSGGTPLTSRKEYFDGDIPFIRSGEINFDKTEQFISELGLKSSSAKMVEIGDILYALYGATSGEVGISKIKGAINQAILCIKSIENHYFLYSYLLFKKEIITKTYLQGGQGNLSAEIVKQIELSIPTIEEQNKIAIFLDLIETRIQTQSKIIEQLETLIRDFRNQIFKQNIRLKDDSGNEFPEWETCRLSDISSRIIQKNADENQNVLTISAQFGLISQLEFFNKSISAKDVTGYYLLEKNDFAYNKSYSNGYPMGAIKRLEKYNKGVVSTLYICFRLNQTVSVDFMEQYFESGIQNVEIEKIAQEGARNHGLLNVGVSDFFNIEINLPSIGEQERIASFLSTVDKKIQCEKAILEQLENQKKYLLQQMFV